MLISSINSIADAHRLLNEAAAANPSTPAGKVSADSEKQKQIAVAAKQFEAIILRQMLSPAIEPMMTGGALGGEKGDSGGGGGIYAYMLTDVMANCLSQGGGMGLSKIIEKQLTPRGSVPAAQAASVYGAGENKKS